jgi:hypothetical protein
MEDIVNHYVCLDESFSREVFITKCLHSGLLVPDSPYLSGFKYLLVYSSYNGIRVAAKISVPRNFKKFQIFED